MYSIGFEWKEYAPGFKAAMYIDYSILFVQEIILPEGYEPIYKIQIQNEKKFVVLKVIDGEIEEVLRSNL